MASSALPRLLEQRLSDYYHIRADLSRSSDGRMRVDVLASLLNAYDPSWSLPNVPNLIGKKETAVAIDQEKDAFKPYWTDKSNLKTIKG